MTTYWCGLGIQLRIYKDWVQHRYYHPLIKRFSEEFLLTLQITVMNKLWTYRNGYVNALPRIKKFCVSYMKAWITCLIINRIVKALACITVLSYWYFSNLADYHIHMCLMEKLTFPVNHRKSQLILVVFIIWYYIHTCIQCSSQILMYYFAVHGSKTPTLAFYPSKPIQASWWFVSSASVSLTIDHFFSHFSSLPSTVFSVHLYYHTFSFPVNLASVSRVLLQLLSGRSHGSVICIFLTLNKHLTKYINMGREA